MTGDPDERVRQLWQAALTAEVIANNPVRAHRAVLGEHPNWQPHYEDLDAPPGRVESRWAANQRQIALPHDDPPF